MVSRVSGGKSALPGDGPAGDAKGCDERNTVWVTQSQNRVSYEVQTNDVAFVRR